MKTEKIYTISESELKQLIEKVQKNITDKTNKKGEYSIGCSISNSVKDTIQNFFTKNNPTKSEDAHLGGLSFPSPKS